MITPQLVGRAVRGLDKCGHIERCYDHSSVLRLVNLVRAALAFACFVAGTVAFLRFFFLIPTLRKERIGQLPSKIQLWIPWLPGQFTRTGARLRRQMNGLMLLGWGFLIAGLLLSPR